MTEYFVYATTFPAPLVGDESTSYIEANTPKEAWEKQRQEMIVRRGEEEFDWMFYCEVYLNADAYHKKQKPLFATHTERAKKWIKKLEMQNRGKE